MPTLWAIGLLTVSLDALVWGIAAHAIHRGLGGARERWLVPAAVAALAFVVWDHWIFSALVGLSGFPSSRARLSLPRVAEIGVAIAVTAAGFRLGRALLDAAVRRLARPADPLSGPGSTPAA